MSDVCLCMQKMDGRKDLKKYIGHRLVIPDAIRHKFLKIPDCGPQRTQHKDTMSSMRPLNFEMVVELSKMFFAAMF